MIHFNSLHKNRGVALIVCMLLLLVLTMLSMSGAQTATLELRMASNMADRAKAFQAAEYALKYAQKYVTELALTGEHEKLFGISPGLYKTLHVKDGDDCTTSTPWLSKQASWNDLDSIEIPNSIDITNLNLNKKPRFMAGYDNEFDTNSPCYANSEPEGYSNSIGSQGTTLKTEKFTITVIGYGSHPNTKVRLQTTFNALN